MKQIKRTANEPSMWEQMLNRFTNSLCDCRDIDKHISECRMLIASCRAAEAAHLSCESNRAVLALHLRLCGFRPTHPDDLDCVTEYLDAVHRCNNQLMLTEENAVRAVMRMPFAYKMLPSDTKQLYADIAALTKTAERTIKAADKLTKEFTIAGLVCDIVDKVEAFAMSAKDADSAQNDKLEKVLRRIDQLEDANKMRHKETIAAINSHHAANPDRRELATFIVRVQKELYKRRFNKDILSLPYERKVKLPSIGDAIDFINGKDRKPDDKWSGRCADFIKDARMLAQSEGKSYETVLRGLRKFAQRKRYGEVEYDAIMGNVRELERQRKVVNKIREEARRCGEGDLNGMSVADYVRENIHRFNPDEVAFIFPDDE